jgi:hypothetical protein
MAIEAAVVVVEATVVATAVIAIVDVVGMDSGHSLEKPGLEPPPVPFSSVYDLVGAFFGCLALSVVAQQVVVCGAGCALNHGWQIWYILDKIQRSG